jgi:hypothetical protein
MKIRLGALALLGLYIPSANASLENDGVWAAGVWATTAWADGVWSEGVDPGVTVPDVIGMTEEDADTALEGAGLDTGAVATVCSAAEAGNVVSQAPPAGASVPPGSTVDLALSSGEACTGAGGKLKLRLDLRL